MVPVFKKRNRKFLTYEVCFGLILVKSLSLISLLVFFSLSCFADASVRNSHHTADGFKNPNPNFETKGLWNVISWQFQRFQLPHSLDPKDYPPFPILQNDGNQLLTNHSKLSVTWVGHATTLIQIDGVNILTDPIWSERCSPVSFIGPKRYTPPGIKIENLPRIDIVILSHNHYDHTDLPTLKQLEEKFHPLVFTGIGNSKLLLAEGLKNVKEMDWWEETKTNDLSITFTPTQHFSGRGLFDRDETLWGSYLISGEKEKVYFGGDTGYYTHFREISERLGPIDVAILPIGATEPRWMMEPVHVDPIQAVQAFVDLKAKYLVPMHYMTFVLSDEALDSPVPRTKEELKRAGISEDHFIPLKIGESRFF
ncbi:beta-lactamase family protein [Leptospira terpstrae serovar Hualin str. LT 11-33 = ATCC 700639]|uniref:Beta-lactamase family protein n=1 Tax=Leptospira terpstrae serovar Hualin str. LT 11-33 = ATCC 700639 TaxID=1257025 RepID=N1VPG2_9LEPT|nr:beta-lactamase family protein [Leptospira terpstrae serovar Hualin str. LT 11-33 = ATCC 700639]